MTGEWIIVVRVGIGSPGARLSDPSFRCAERAKLLLIPVIARGRGRVRPKRDTPSQVHPPTPYLLKKRRDITVSPLRDVVRERRGAHGGGDHVGENQNRESHRVEIRSATALTMTDEDEGVCDEKIFWLFE